MVEATNASVLNRNDKRTCASTGAVTDCRHQLRAVVCDGDANDKRAENVEGEQSVDEAVGGLGNVDSGVLGLASSGSDEFWRHDEGESRFDERVPEGQELPGVSIGHEWVECTWLLPITEP